MVWRLRKCFCGFSLKSSCIATALILIVFCCAAVISEISVLATDGRLTENEKIAAYVVIAVVTLIMLPSSILLLYGVQKSIQRPVLVWFGVTAFLFIPQIVGMFLNIDEGFIVYMLTSCALAVELYMMALVYSYLVEQGELKRRLLRAAARRTTALSAVASTSSAVPPGDTTAMPGPSRCLVEVMTHAPPPPERLAIVEEDEEVTTAGRLQRST